jgi:catechol 2,3-dioxygenase-like lactoylglutathione lyase family enzyme
MSLRGCPLLYVFLESSELQVQRTFFEENLGLELIEIEPHLPHHRHGVVKYDAGNLIVSLNEATNGVFRDGCSDGLLMVFNTRTVPHMDHGIAPGFSMSKEDGLLSDKHGHHYLCLTNYGNGSAPQRPIVIELRLVVNNLAAATSFYQDKLDLRLLDRTEHTARFATGSAVLAIEERQTAPDGKRPRAEGYLMVFYTSSIEETFKELAQRGVPFKGGIATSEIGRTIRFQDNSGHRFCAYEPSMECLGWGSGTKVLEIAGLSKVREST